MDRHLYNFPTTINKIIDPIEEANKRYAEKLKVERTKPVYDSRKTELLTQLDADYDLALKTCGLELIKRICIIDQELAHNILSIFAQAVENDNFDDVEMNFRKLIARKIDEEKGIYRQR